MSETIRVLQLVRPAEGGIRSHVISLLSGLDASRFASTLVCPPDSDLYRQAHSEGFTVVPLEFRGEMDPARDVSAALSLRRLILRERPHILHMHSMKAGLIGRMAVLGMRRRPATIVTYHSFPFGERVGKAKRRIAAASERLLEGRTDLRVAVSRALGEELTASLGVPASRLTVVYNGVRFPEDARTRSERPVVGTVARLAPQKGVEYLIRAVPLVLSRFPDARFVIVGDGPRRAELQTLAQTLGCQDAVEFVGYLSSPAGVVRTLDAFVLPSTWEAFGITLVEAMAMGVPVVASRVGGIPEIIDGETTGLFAEPGDPSSIADGVCRLLADRESSDRMGEAGRAFVRERFGVERMLSETAGLYERIIEDKSIS